METGAKEMVKKEENNDRFSTIANAGDRKKPLEKAKRSIGSMFRRSVKVEISPAEVENKEYGQLAKPVKQEPSKPASSRIVMKKEETSDNWSTMAVPEMPLSTSLKSPTRNTRPKKMQKIPKPAKASKFMNGDLVDTSVSPVTSAVPAIPASAFIFSSKLNGANKAKRPARFESGPIKVNSIGSSSPDSGRNKRSVWESGSEDHNDGDSDVDNDFNETGLSKQGHAKNNTNNAKDNRDEGQFTCLDCTATFETDAAFKQHIASHHGYRRFKCTVCEKRFTFRSYLVVHMRRHTGERPFGCNVCEKKFATSGDLNVHKRFHTGVKAFKCDVCEKCFTLNRQLTVHMRIHTGEKPFKCDVCKKCFSESGSLAKHKLIHTGEKPYKCLSCGLSFRHKCNLKTHKRAHHSDADAGSQLEAPQNGMDQSSAIDACDPLGNSINGQKIRYKSKSIGYVVEKMTSSNPDVVFLVWSKQFTMELASAVASSGYNCILCVNKIQPQPFRDVVKLSNSLHICLVEVGPDSTSLRLFSFGGMVLPEKITNHGTFKSLAKLESKMRRFSQSEGMEMVNIFKHSKKNSGWYRSLKEGLKGECIITDQI